MRKESVTTVTAVTVIDIAVTVVTVDTADHPQVIFFPFIAWKMSGKGGKNKAAIYQDFSISKQGEL